MSDFLPGIEVSARGLRWEIVDTQPLGEQTLYRLRGLEGVARGMEFDILSPLENISPLSSEINPEKAAPLQNWLIYHQAFLLEQALGKSAILSVQPGRLKIEPYQIVPLMRALKMHRPRLLLCDDVGLGKTIQAALIVTELMARRLAHRVLIVSPAGPLLKQWKSELLERFGLRVEVIDRDKIEEVKRGTELGANPFDQIPLGLISIDFLKQEKILEQIERTSYDIVIIDEAHHCADLGGNQDYEDSLRRKLAQVLANKSDVLLLLTATPHNGNDRSFASLLELLDMSLVDGRGVLRGEKYRPYVVRRLKKHIKDHITGEPKFKDRQVIPVEVRALKDKHSAFIVFQKAHLDLIAPELKSAFRTRRYSDVLAFIALLKRSVSTVYACLETLKVVRDRFEQFIEETSGNQERRKERIKTLREYVKNIEKFGTISFEEEEEQQYLVAEDIAEQLSMYERDIRKGTRKLKWSENISEAINKLIELAEKAVVCDPKLDAIIEEIKQIRVKEPKTNILIYTEYTDSLSKVLERLKAENLNKILAISGGAIETERIKITEQFRREDNIILVSTDASAEGLNLHEKCHHLIHLELPFNPNRLEQRNGRIDRYGQDRNPVIRYLFLKNTFEDRILLRLIAKHEKQRSMLSFVPNTLGITCSTDASCERLLKGIVDDDAKLFKDPEVRFDFNNPEEDALSEPAIKELLEEIDRSFKGFEKIAKNNIWLGESGVNTEAELISEAVQAREEGWRLTNVDLLQFVSNAVFLDGGNINRDGEIIEIVLPSLWSHGLDDLPGHNADNRTIKITTNMDIVQDAQGNTVGFLGRSHPLVKKALERVRSISFGGESASLLDHRATAVVGDDKTPCLLFTFLVTIATRKTKLFEKVIAVKIDKNDSLQTLFSCEEWLKYTDSGKAINTADIWSKYFSSWGNTAKEKAKKIANEIFESVASKYITDKKHDLEDEKKKLIEWFNTRVAEITGTVIKPIQRSLFESQEKTEYPHWATLSEPEERISAFASDKKNPRSKCSEADTLLSLYKKRMKELEELSSFDNTAIRPLGILMIVPEEAKHVV